MKRYITIIFLLLLLPALMFGQTETLKSLAEKFNAPTGEYRPHALWHSMGVNISKEGMNRDLEAMKESGIGGVYIFNVGGVIDNPKWKERTWRSDYYWEALRHATAETKRLGLKIGIHNTPGFSATGGPWISQEQGMQKIVFYKKQIQGGKLLDDTLQRPAPVTGNAGKSSFYRDIAVYAVPVKENVSVSEVIDISTNMDAEGRVKWQASEGDWQLVRIGHVPIMKSPVPLPSELYGALEVDKMSRKHNVYHWQQVLNPLIEHLKEYIGDSFIFVSLDSYEAGAQDWTETYRSDFQRLKGYDPVPWIALRYTAGNAKEREDLKVFEQDNRDVVSRLMIDNGWKTAAEMVHAAGLKFYWEPYGGPFDTNESAGIPDMPMVEFWTGGILNDKIMHKAIKEMIAHDQRIIAAEAFTGRPDSSRYTEDPAFLKHCADSMYASGVNQTYLHHWVHQPFDDRYRPGMDFNFWGTHFGRHQTWLRPGKAFFTYLSRCQMLLQQGSCVEITSEWAHRRTPEAEMFFVRNPQKSVIKRNFAFPVKGRVPELWDAYHGTIRQTGKWNAAGDSIFVELTLQPEESVFVVFPYNKEENYSRLPEIEIIDSKTEEITGAWDVTFQPAVESPFKRKLQSLIDFGKQNDKALKYFSGTAVYRKNIRISAGDIKEGYRVMLELGEMYDIAELTVNGKHVGVLWNPPYNADITPFLKPGNNTFEIAVTNNWANRMIGDEQEPPDFEVVERKFYSLNTGWIMTAFPDWFLNDLPRPSQGRKTFNLYHYYNAESPLFPAGLVGPVRIVKQKIKIL
jgi:hypothetical protein